MDKLLEIPINNFEQNLGKKEISPRLEGLFKAYYDKVMGFINGTPYDYEMTTNTSLWQSRYFQAKKDAQIQFGQDVFFACENDPEISLEVRKLLSLEEDQVITSGMLEELLPKDKYYKEFNECIEYKKNHPEEDRSYKRKAA